MLAAGDAGLLDPVECRDAGLFANDTRFLSRYVWSVNGRTPVCVEVIQDGYAQAQYRYVLDPEPVERAAIVNAVADDALPTLECTVTREIHRGGFTDTMAFDVPAGHDAVLVLSVESDFADLFEVRTHQWQGRPGISSVFDGAALATSYRSEHVEHETVVRISGDIASLAYGNGACSGILACGRRAEVHVAVETAMSIPCRESGPFSSSMIPCKCEHTEPGGPRLVSAPEHVLRAWNGAKASLRALRLQGVGPLQLPEGVFSYAAGAPWFMTLFGRDSLTTSLQTLLDGPQAAYGTLAALQHFQATEAVCAIEAEPGKILHEVRVGEWTHAKRTPHQPYYGAHDTPALFLMLLGALWRWTNDTEMLRQFQAAAARCISWIEQFGDCDQDGFQEYWGRAEGNVGAGAGHFSWKDNDDSIPCEDGSCPKYPVAMCEMQGYVYQAYCGMAPLFGAWGDSTMEASVAKRAERLLSQFSEIFWDSELTCIPIALDGSKKPVRGVSSNAGHCLWTRIVEQERGQQVGAHLAHPSMFTGWGVRTLSSAHAQFDPLSYHLGSVWPHDSVICAHGLRQYGMHAEAAKIIAGLFDASSCYPDAVLPELFGGYGRNEGCALATYPFMNRPQAWASGAVIHAIQCLLGLEPDLPSHVVRLDPILPSGWSELAVEDIPLGTSLLTVKLARTPRGTLDVDASCSGTQLSIEVNSPMAL